ncbi:hypothetical protein BJ912DRAFT_997326 [Pholiota molesta]|nr:hypothetical protein BJ912DRAFT_997326 [Pholiota molesta]
MMIGVIQAAARARIPTVKIHLAMCLSCQRVSAHWHQKYPLDSVAIRTINASPHQTFRYLETFISHVQLRPSMESDIGAARQLQVYGGTLSGTTTPHQSSDQCH